jgi:hypothetical protein
VIEPKIEELLSARLQDTNFLDVVAAAYSKSQEVPISVSDVTAIRRQIENLTARRGRILEAFFDGSIDRSQRDEQLAKVDAELQAYKAMAMPTTVAGSSLSAADLAQLFSVFVEMPFLQRNDKRSLLKGLGVEIFVRGYEICSVAIRNVAGLGCNTDNRSKMGPSVLLAPPCR